MVNPPLPAKEERPNLYMSLGASPLTIAANRSNGDPRSIYEHTLLLSYRRKEGMLDASSSAKIGICHGHRAGASSTKLRLSIKVFKVTTGLFLTPPALVGYHLR